MPKACSHYRHLSVRFADLKSKFLDSEINAENADPANFKADLDKIAAFRLLLHAEVEHFLESKALEKLDALASLLDGGGVWQRENPHALSMYCLVAFNLPANKEPSDESLRSHFSEVIDKARSMIKENNGIKEKSFALLSVFSGKCLDEVDSTTSSLLNSYGKERGEVAHKTVARTNCLSAPSAELTNASTIVSALSAYFDVEP